jgi:V/A-type H+-transporting ATPase subunit F
MYNAAVMGDKDSISGFASLGLDIFPEATPETAGDTLRKLADNNYAVVYITEALAAAIEDEIDKYKNKELPAIILIPGITGNTGAGLANVSKAVERAVGSDILN